MHFNDFGTELQINQFLFAARLTESAFLSCVLPRRCPKDWFVKWGRGEGQGREICGEEDIQHAIAHIGLKSATDYVSYPRMRCGTQLWLGAWTFILPQVFDECSRPLCTPSEENIAAKKSSNTLNRTKYYKVDLWKRKGLKSFLSQFRGRNSNTDVSHFMPR